MSRLTCVVNQKELCYKLYDDQDNIIDIKSENFVNDKVCSKSIIDSSINISYSNGIYISEISQIKIVFDQQSHFKLF